MGGIGHEDIDEDNWNTNEGCRLRQTLKTNRDGDEGGEEDGGESEPGNPRGVCRGGAGASRVG